MNYKIQPLKLIAYIGDVGSTLKYTHVCTASKKDKSTRNSINIIGFALRIFGNQKPKKT